MSPCIHIAFCFLRHEQVKDLVRPRNFTEMTLYHIEWVKIPYNISLEEKLSSSRKRSYHLYPTKKIPLKTLPSFKVFLPLSQILTEIPTLKNS